MKERFLCFSYTVKTPIQRLIIAYPGYLFRNEGSYVPLTLIQINEVIATEGITAIYVEILPAQNGDQMNTRYASYSLS